MIQAHALGYLAVFVPPGLLMVGRALEQDWLLPVAFFMIMPLLRAVFGSVGERREDWSEASAKFLLMVPVVYCLAIVPALCWSFAGAVSSGLTGWRAEVFCLALAMVGALAHCVAHDLVHRQSPWARRLGMMVAAAAGHPFFGFEHLAHHAFNRDDEGGHVPRRDENVYQFAWRRMLAVPGQAIDWSRVMMSRARNPSVLDSVWVYVAITAACAAGATLIHGWAGLAWYVAVTLVVPFLLNLVTYVQHWGLGYTGAPGLGPQDHVAWEDDCRLQRWMVLGLSAHNEHHWAPRRPYFLNGFVEGAPRLPGSYSIMVLIALVPAAWRRVMDKARAEWDEAEATRTTSGGSAFCFRG